MKRVTLVNGEAVPCGLTASELAEMLNTTDMQQFSLACEALRNLGTNEAYGVLKSFLRTKEPYKRRYLLSVIFSFDASAELREEFIHALRSGERMFVTTALTHLVERNLWTSDEEILSCFEKNQRWLDSYYYHILTGIAKTEKHTARVVKLFQTAPSNSVKIAAAECLPYFATEENYLRLYALLAGSSMPKLRLEACRIAAQFGRKDLLAQYEHDKDGHIRKLSKRAMELG